MEMRVIMAGSPGCLENDNIADIKLYSCASVENVLQTGVPRLHEWTEQCRVAKKPGVKKVGHGQNHMSISYAGKETSTDEVSPAVGINFGTRQAETRFTGKSDTAYFSAGATSVLNKPSFVRITAIKHFLDSFVVVWIVEAWIDLLERIPMIIKDLFECAFIDAFHGYSLRITIARLMQRSRKELNCLMLKD